MARRPLRCLVLATKSSHLGVLAGVPGSAPPPSRALSVLADPSRFIDVERGLTFLGIVGITDPARPEVSEAIAQCHRAGIRVIMITGDCAATAAAIARDVNILVMDAVRLHLPCFFQSLGCVSPAFACLTYLL